jgi:hypothetical protein
MRSNGRNDFLIEVPLVAYHMRETPRHVRQSLRLLEMKESRSELRQRITGN